MSLLRARPRIDATAFVADGAVVVGDVTVGAESSIWFGCVVRGDRSPVTIGDRCNVQDGCIVHEDPEFPVVIGNDVSMGHGAVVHGATVEDEVLIGIRSTVLNGAVIGRGSIIGAGAVVTSGMQVPPGSLVLGIPGKVMRPVDDKGLALIQRTRTNYVRLSRQYLALRDEAGDGSESDPA